MLSPVPTSAQRAVSRCCCAEQGLEGSCQPGYSPASRLGYLPQVQTLKALPQGKPLPRVRRPKDEWRLGRGCLALQPEGGSGGQDKGPLLSSWLSRKQGDTGRPQPPHEGRQCDLCCPQCACPQSPLTQQLNSQTILLCSFRLPGRV